MCQKPFKVLRLRQEMGSFGICLLNYLILITCNYLYLVSCMDHSVSKPCPKPEMVDLTKMYKAQKDCKWCFWTYMCFQSLNVTLLSLKVSKMTLELRGNCVFLSLVSKTSVWPTICKEGEVSKWFQHWVMDNIVSCSVSFENPGWLWTM